VLHFVAVFCSLLQCVVVCCSVSQCVAVWGGVGLIPQSTQSIPLFMCLCVVISVQSTPSVTQSTLLYSTVLYCTLLYYTSLYSNVLHSILLYSLSITTQKLIKRG